MLDAGPAPRPQPVGPLARTSGLGVSRPARPAPAADDEGFMGACSRPRSRAWRCSCTPPDAPARAPGADVAFGVGCAVFFSRSTYKATTRSAACRAARHLSARAAGSHGTSELAAADGGGASYSSSRGSSASSCWPSASSAAAEFCSTRRRREPASTGPVVRLGAWTAPRRTARDFMLGDRLHKCAPGRALPWILLMLTRWPCRRVRRHRAVRRRALGLLGALAMTPSCCSSAGGPGAGRDSDFPAGLLDAGAPGDGRLSSASPACRRRGQSLSPRGLASAVVTVVAVALGVLLGTATPHPRRRRGRRSEAGDHRATRTV